MKPALLILMALAAPQPALAQSNLVVIVVDQLSHWATDPAQRAPLELPSIDELASQGTVFTRAYATSPVCSANRYALLTGRYPFLGTDKLQPGTATLGTLLAAAGWDTGYVGKWHLSPGGGSASQYVDPADRPGWRFFAGHEGSPHDYLTGLSYEPGNTAPVSTAPWEPTWQTGQALRFLREQRSRPFALIVNYGPPHPAKGTQGYTPPVSLYRPLQVVPRPNVAKADRPAAKRRIAAYMGLCASMDVEVGVLLAEIDLATTLVVLTSDHGDMLYSHGAGHLQKRRPWEESAHIPLVMAGPGVAAGEQDSGLIATVDLLPSLFQLVSVAVPSAVQGAAFPSGARVPAAVYFGQDDGEKAWLGERWRGLVDGRWKYAVSEGGTELLFDLTLDPFERTPREDSPDCADERTALRAAIRARAVQLGDRFPFPGS